MNMDQFPSRDTVYFHITCEAQVDLDKAGKIYLCKLLCEHEMLKIFVLLKSEWISCSVFSISELIEPYSNFLGMSWISFRHDTILALIFNRYFIYLERNVIFNAVFSSLKGSLSEMPPPQVSPILSTFSVMDSEESLYMSSLKKINFLKTISSFTSTSRGIIIADDQGLGYISCLDSMIIYIPGLFGNFYILHAVSFFAEFSVTISYSYVLCYSINEGRYFLIKATFGTLYTLPSFFILPDQNEFQMYLKTSIPNPYALLSCSCSLIGSSMHIFIASKMKGCYSHIKIDDNDMVNTWLIDRTEENHILQALLVTFNGALMETEYNTIASTFMTPLFPRAISVAVTMKGMFLNMGKEKIPLPCPSNLILNEIFRQGSVGIFIYDYRIVFLLDHKAESPICFELDFFANSYLTLATPFCFSQCYKMLLGFNLLTSLCPYFACDLLLAIYSLKQDVLDALLGLFQSQLYYKERLSSQFSLFRLFCLCLHEDLNIVGIFQKQSYAISTNYFSEFFNKLLGEHMFESYDLNACLVACLLDHLNVGNITLDSILFPAPSCSFLFPRIYFCVKNWIDLVDGDYVSLSSISNFLGFSMAILEDISPKEIIINGKALIRLPKLINPLLLKDHERCTLSTGFELCSRISHTFTIYVLLLKEKYRLVSDYITPNTFANIEPNVVTFLLNFFGRIDIIKSMSRSKDVFLSGPPSCVNIEYMRQAFSLDLIENLTFFRLENDHSQIESFVGFENATFVYLKEADLLKIQSILTETIVLKNVHMPTGLLLVSSVEVTENQPLDHPGVFSSLLSQVKQKIYFSTHSTTPNFEVPRQRRLFEFLLCTKAVLEFKEKIDLSYVLSIRPKSKSSTSFTSFYHWSAFLFGLGLLGNFTRPYPQDVIFEFISVPELTTMSSSSMRSSGSLDASLISASSFLLSSGISFIGTKDILLTKSASMHFPSIVFSNHLTPSACTFDSNLITYPIIDLPHHCVVISAILCSGLLYAQFPHVQLLKVFLNEFLYLFSISSFSNELKQFSFKNSGCRWYWSSFCKIAHSGRILDYESTTSASIYSHFEPITGLYQNRSFSEIHKTHHIRIDNQFYPYYLSRIKGFSLEGHSFAICFSLGISLFSIGSSTNINLDGIVSDILSVLFLSRNNIIILNHPTVISPLLLSLCLGSFGGSLKSSPIEKLVRPLIMNNPSLYSIRTDVLFNLVFYLVNSRIDNFRFDDFIDSVPSEVSWLLKNIGLDFNYGSNYNDFESFFPLHDYKRELAQSSKFNLLRRLLYCSHTGNDPFFAEIALRFHLPIYTQFFLGQALISSLTCLTAYLFSKVLYFLKSRSNELPQRFNFIHHCLRYVYALLDYPFYDLVDERIILDPSFSFSTSSFNFKSTCTLLMIQFETLITISSLSHMGRPSAKLANFLTYLRSINLSPVDIPSILMHQKKWRHKQTINQDFDCLLNFSILRSLSNVSRYQSCLSRSLGHLFMKRTDLSIFK